jgi:hypothetical protein
MLLNILTLTLEPADPIQFSIAELRSFFAGKLGEYTLLHKGNDTGFIHRYPVIQCKQIKNRLLVIGISQGASFLEQLIRDHTEIPAGKNTCTIVTRDVTSRKEEFGISGVMHTYTFLTPWLALNQQNAKKFYDLKGKSERDAFMLKILLSNLGTLAKSLDYKTPVAVNGDAKVQFRIDWIDRENVIVFSGRFRTNLIIPDYFGIGQSVSQGFGTIQRNPEIHGEHDEVNTT